MQQSGGQIAAEHAEPPDGGEDRLSALPDELLVLILECLDTTAEAVRTSVLARRWYRLWSRLSKLRFKFLPDGNRIRELLDVPDGPELSYISVTSKGAAADSATAWLTAAARRLAGGLVYNSKNVMENDEEKARRGGNVQLPCFEKATMIQLSGLCGLVLPSVGVFSRLTDLSLSFFNIHGPCELQELQIDFIWVYGYDFRREENEHGLRLLQQFQVLHSLHLELIYENDMHYYCQFLLGDITLPQIMFLQLDLRNEGHAFGAILFHLLGLCIGLRRLLLVLSTDDSSSLEEEFSCPFDCICDQPKNWKTDELMLDNLEDVHIIGLQGAEHEVAFVQRLLSWATVLKSLRITLRSEMTEDMIGEFRDALVGFSRPETCIHFDTSDKKRSVHPIDE